MRYLVAIVESMLRAAEGIRAPEPNHTTTFFVQKGECAMACRVHPHPRLFLRSQTVPVIPSDPLDPLLAPPAAASP